MTKLEISLFSLLPVDVRDLQHVRHPIAAMGTDRIVVRKRSLAIIDVLRRG